MAALFTARLELQPITLPLVTAVLEGRRRSDIEALVGAEMPWTWPSRTLVEQVFRASLDEVHADPAKRLWGDRLMILREGPRKVVGSVVFHGRPDQDGRCEVGYGIEDASQGKGYATEALSACIAWALAQPECRVVRATTTSWHKPSARVLEKVGMSLVGESEKEDHKLLVYEISRERGGELSPRA